MLVTSNREALTKGFRKLRRHFVKLKGSSSFNNEKISNEARGKISKEISSRSLFIVGHARSGTTILAEAFNLHREIYMSTEANYFLKQQKSNFVQQYNRIHSAVFGNPVCKSSFMPPITGEGKNYWYDFVCEISKHHHWIGDKFAFSHFHVDEELLDLIKFQASYFFDATYVHIIREPIATIISTQKLLPVSNILLHAKSWLFVVKNWIRMVMLFPNCYSILHENLSLAVFNQLLDKLKLEKVITKDLFNKAHVRQHKLEEVDGRNSIACLEKLNEIYSQLQKAIPANLNEFDITLKMPRSYLYDLDQTCSAVLKEIEAAR